MAERLDRVRLTANAGANMVIVEYVERIDTNYTVNSNCVLDRRCSCPIFRGDRSRVGSSSRDPRRRHTRWRGRRRAIAPAGRAGGGRRSGDGDVAARRPDLRAALAVPAAHAAASGQRRGHASGPRARAVQAASWRRGGSTPLQQGIIVYTK